MIRPASSIASIAPVAGATQLGTAVSGTSSLCLSSHESVAVRALAVPATRKPWIGVLRKALDALHVFPPPFAFNDTVRRQTMPVRVQSYSSSPDAARRLFGYDDAQLSVAVSLVRDRFAMRAPQSAHVGEVCDGIFINSPLAHFLGTQPFRALFLLLADPDLGLTSADLRVAGFYDTREGKLLSFSLPFLMVAPGSGRYFDHEGDDRGRTLDQLAAFIHERREQVFLVDACADRPRRLVRFDRCRSAHDVEDQLMKLCREVSAFFGVSAAGESESTVIVSSRESTCAYIGHPVRLPTLAEARRLHLSFDVTPELAGSAGNERKPLGKNVISKNTIASIGFGDLGFPPATSPIPKLPNAYRTIQQDLRDTIPPFADSLATFRTRNRAKQAIECVGTKTVSEADLWSHTWTSCEPILLTLETLLRDTPRLLEQTATVGTVESLRLAREIVGRLRASFSAGGVDAPALVEALSRACSRLDDAEHALQAVERLEAADAGGEQRQLILRCRRQEALVLTQAWEQIFVLPDCKYGEPSGGAPAVVALTGCVEALADRLYQDMLPVAERPPEELIRGIGRHLETVRRLPDECSRAAVRRALASINALRDDVRSMPAAQRSSVDIESSTRKISRTLEMTIRKLDRIVLVSDPAWQILEAAARAERAVPDGGAPG